MVTYHRHLLDQMLKEHQHFMQGVVIDIGGKKRNPKGNFRPPKFADNRWLSLNINLETQPDIVADAHDLPFKINSADCLLCCEVLEHVKKPELCATEMMRVLKPGGTLILSVPFLYPLHVDPHDLGRFTPHTIHQIFSGENKIEITSMGGWLGTMGMLLELGARKIEGFFGARLLRGSLRVIGRTLSYLETVGLARDGRFQSFSTGYFCVIHKSFAHLGRG
jgi:SAM-dependent methyltransferase